MHSPHDARHSGVLGTHKIGNEAYSFKSSPFGTLSSERSAASGNSSALAKQAKTTAVIADVIYVAKEGQINYRDSIKTSDTSGIVVKMIPNAGNVTDADGNVYQSVRIGNQVWTVENLRTTKYNDSSDIPLVPDSTAWSNLTTPGYCWYNNDATNKAKYGGLYNWYTVNPANPKQIAPAGWHLPTDAEWDTLENYLIANGYNWDGTTTGRSKIAKSMAAKTDWFSSTSNGAIGNDLSKNNASGFSALPGGARFGGSFGGSFAFQSYNGYWWSSTKFDTDIALLRALLSNLDYLYHDFFFKSCGLSVRLVRD